jgi:hypothetical protein
MRRSALIVAVFTSTLLVAAPASAGPAEEATGFVTSIMDKFNGGDSKAFVAAHEDNAVIVDEFGRHIWTGTGTAKQWLDDFTKMSSADGITSPRVDYGKPLQANSDGNFAYVVLPTTYRFVQKGAKMAEPGSMTFVVHHYGQQWKIVSWTYSGGAASPDK